MKDSNNKPPHQEHSGASGVVSGVNAGVVTSEVSGAVALNEVAYIVHHEVVLKAEVVRIEGSRVDLQVFESTRSLVVGDTVRFSGRLLSAQLGPGLLGKIYDGLQNPLTDLALEDGIFLTRGHYLDPLDSQRKWHFTSRAKVGDTLYAGYIVGQVPERLFSHAIMVPFGLRGAWQLASVVDEGDYTIDTVVATLTNTKGEERAVSMRQYWPVKRPIRAYQERLKPAETLVTGIRIIDTFIPVSRGGTYCIPGPFGAGKTVLQQITSRNADVDIVIIAACGERAGEVVETLQEFPQLTDPRTGRSLMERTIIIVNTSSMPVAARESSVYTAITLAEYYRQMGLNILLLADSTSRWAQAMRELSGRLEEIPGEEAFPAYLESVIASFYERAGVVRLHNGERGSVTVGGTVSPAGGNFEEPVTQATLKVVGAFHGLSRERSEARKYPSIDPLESWSKYPSILESHQVDLMRDVLSRGDEVAQMIKVVGEEGTVIADYVCYLKSELVDAVFLQQNAFDEVDKAVAPERQRYTFALLQEILEYTFPFEEREEARQFFNHLRQLFLDWNGSAWRSEQFKKYNRSIKHLLISLNATATAQENTENPEHPEHTEQSESSAVSTTAVPQ